MTRYLLDTNVISEMSRRRPYPAVVELIETAEPGTLALSVLSLGEIRRGAVRQRHRNPAAAEAIFRWLAATEARFADRIMPVTAEIAHRWGEITADRSRPAVDTLIAATALVHGLTVVTRNGRDFSGLGVHVLNPWA